MVAKMWLTCRGGGGVQTFKICRADGKKVTRFLMARLLKAEKMAWAS